MNRYYVKTKREKFGFCNICTEKRDLSWDHVPPKGGIVLSAMEMETIHQAFTVDIEKRRYSESQNGVKFRTICSECNSILGSKYDPVINDFASSVGRFIKSSFKFPNIILIRTNPNKLIRGLLGHLLSSKVHF